MACTGHYNNAVCVGHTVGACSAHNAATCAGHVATGCHSHTSSQCVSHVATHPCTNHTATACASHVGVVSGGEATIWTDDPLSSSVKIKAIHWNELQVAISNELVRRGQFPLTGGDVTTSIKISSGEPSYFRNMINVAGRFATPPVIVDEPELSDDVVNRNFTIKKEAPTILRNKINDLETNCACNCNYACTCQCNYACTCNCNYACTCQCNYACTCNCNYGCTCQCNYVCTCNCNYACTCQCNYACTCNCNYACTCNCNYACTCNCNYACTCNCNYICTCNCAYSDERLKTEIAYL